MPENSRAGAVDIDRLIDAAPWSGLQKIAIALAALTIIFDGFDNQALGFAIPSLTRDWGVNRGDFSPVLAIGLIGMTVGTAIAGFIGDRIGRRATLIGSVLIFGIMTMITSFSHDLITLGALRFLAGLGMGGAMPNATAIAAEFTPSRSRTLAVNLTIVCIPLGGMIGGLVAAQILPSLGWRALFLTAGGAPAIFAVILFFAMPESPSFLIGRPRRWPELARLMNRFGHGLDPLCQFHDGSGTPAVKQRNPLAMLFSRGVAQDTIWLWIAFFLCLLAVYSIFNWVPSMLSGIGFNLAIASLGLASFNMGGIAGAIGGAVLIGRLGSRIVMTAINLGGIVAAALLALTIGQMHGATSLILSLGFLGMCMNCVQTTMFALASHVYPNLSRATGVGAALAIGRLGAVLSSYTGAATLAMGGTALYFGVIALALTGTAGALLMIGRHIQPTAALPPHL